MQDPSSETTSEITSFTILISEVVSYVVYDDVSHVVSYMVSVAFSYILSYDISYVRIFNSGDLSKNAATEMLEMLSKQYTFWEEFSESSLMENTKIFPINDNNNKKIM